MLKRKFKLTIKLKSKIKPRLSNVFWQLITFNFNPISGL